MIGEALSTVGAARSIVIDETNEVLAGNGVLQAAPSAGISRVQVVDADGGTIVAVRRTGLTPTQKRALALYDNRTAELAEWNVEQLAADLTNGEDLSAFFLDAELTRLGVTAPLVQGLTDPDAVPPTRPTTTIQRGDLFALGAHRLLCGDATDARDVARVLDHQPADLCFTSPPYNLGRSVGLRRGPFHGQATAYPERDDDDDPAAWGTLMARFTAEALPVARYVAVNVQLLAGNKRALLAWLGGLADHVVDVLIWAKHGAPAMAEHVADSAFEFVILLSAEDQPSRAVTSASFSRGTFSNVFAFGQGSNAFTDGQHGATSPVAVTAHYVTNLSPAGARIYEPFMGSGTTVIAAEQHGRTCYGLEIQPVYVQLTIDRWEAFTGRTAEHV